MSRTRPKFPVLLAVAALAACGTAADPTGDTDGGTSSGSGDGGSDGTGTDGGQATTEPVRTATITLGATTRTVTPNVRRGVISPPEALWFGVEATRENASVTLSCLPAARGDKGGRTVSVPSDAVLQMGGIICENGGGGLVDARIAVQRALATACAQKSTCTVNLFDAWMGAIWGCSSPRPEKIQVNYSCVAQPSFAPAMVFEYASDDLSVSFSGLDGAGVGSCGERGLRVTVPGHTLQECSLDLTTRTGADLAGVLTATLSDGSETPVPLTVDFRHERNTHRPSLQFFTATQACASTSITHTTTTIEGATTDTLRSNGPFTCNPGGAVLDPAPTVEVAIQRPAAGVTTGFACGERVVVRVNDRATTGNGGCRGAAMDEEPHALRAWLGDLSTCDSANACVNEGTLLINYDFSNPAVAAP